MAMPLSNRGEQPSVLLELTLTHSMSNAMIESGPEWIRPGRHVCNVQESADHGIH